MARPKLSVTTPRGTFTRESARPYAFVVVISGRTPARLDADLRGSIKSAKSNMAYCLEQVAAGGTSWQGAEKYQADADRYVKLIERWEEELEANGSLSAEERNRVAVADWSDPTGAQWSSRLELAKKAAENIVSYGYAAAEVYEVATGKLVFRTGPLAHLLAEG